MYFAWNIVPKLYMCICIVLWMYFLIVTPEPSVIFLSSCLLYRVFEDLPGTSPALVLDSPYFYCTVYYMSYSLCLHLKRTALWLKRAWILCGEMHFYLFKSPRWVLNRKDCYPPTLDLSIKLMELLGFLYVHRMVTLMSLFYLPFMVIWLW